MQMRRAALLGLLGLAAGSSAWAGLTVSASVVAPAGVTLPAAATPANVTARADLVAAHSLIAQCAQRADATVRGLDALRSACPGIEAAVRDLGLDALLPADWAKEASPQALTDLDALAERYGAPAPALQLNASSLQAIAVALVPPPSPPTLWERILSWIRSRLGSTNKGSSSWLRYLPHWSIGSKLARALFIIVACLVVITAGVFVAIELRAAGLAGAGRRLRAGGRPSSVSRSMSEGGSLDLAGLDSAAPHERAVLLLKLLVQALRRSSRLGHDRDLTCRELIARARFDTGRQRASFGLIALLAERALYGGPQTAAAATIPDEVLSAARTLYAELLTVPAPVPPATRAAEGAR